MYDRFSDPSHIKWAKTVKRRDKYICQVCGATNVYLHSHHLNSWDSFENQRFDIQNGITCCHICHDNFHHIFSSGHNTKQQFEQFLAFVRVIKQIAKENKNNGNT